MSIPADLKGLQTEERNPRSAEIDKVSTSELCQIINYEDATVASAIRACIPTIAGAIDALTPRIRQGGRVIYVGAGTSGRLGVLDASEIPPTFSASPAQFVGLIAGGDVALRSAKEGAEDSQEAAVEDLDALDLDGKTDSLVGIAASGRTPYVLSSLAFAKSKGCVTIGIACSAPSAMSDCGDVDFMINAVTGPEIVTGSTRMKAGSATKLVLNMLSTGVMIKTGKTFGNIMVDVKPTNVKLQHRARRIIREICGSRCISSDEDLDVLLAKCERNVKVAVVSICFGIPVKEAKARLRIAKEVLANLLQVPSAMSNGIGTHDGPQYVLCVDGGGTKCRAVILDRNSAEGSGEAGPCNPSDIGVEAAAAAVHQAIQRAVDSRTATKGKTIQEMNFAEVWVCLAGADRKALDSHLRSQITKVLGEQPRMTLRVTNDIELLATAAGSGYEGRDVVVLIAGTGSIAMHYRREGSKYFKKARSGGWGALIGDDDSGFDIGRRAIRLALEQLDLKDQSKSSDVVSESQDPLGELVSRYYRPIGADQPDGFDLLSSVLLSGSDDAKSASYTKQRIAQCAKVVLDAAVSSKQAQEIVDSAVQSLIRLVSSLYRRQELEPRETVLAVTGGLMQSEKIQERFRAALLASNIGIKQFEHFSQPASVGAQYLARVAWGDP